MTLPEMCVVVQKALTRAILCAVLIPVQITSAVLYHLIAHIFRRKYPGMTVGEKYYLCRGTGTSLY